MPDEKTEKIEISKFNFWLVTTLLGTLLLGVGAWATSVNNQMVEGQISMARVEGLVASIDNRLKENLEATNRIHKMESDIRALSVSVLMNTEDLQSRRGIRFNMPEYDKYVRPVQEDLLKRLTRIESQIEARYEKN
jgi:hypothetical protein